MERNSLKGKHQMSETTSTTTDPPPVRVECIFPILRVAALDTSIAFYTENLGFTVDWRTQFLASISRDGCALMLCEGAQGNPATWVWVGVTDVDPIFAQCKAKGVTVLLKPSNYFWAREMRIEDPDSHVLRIGSETRKDLPIEEPQGM